MGLAQFAAGLAALARQLEGLGLTGRTALDPRSSAATQLMAMYEQMGNALARQVPPYAGVWGVGQTLPFSAAARTMAGHAQMGNARRARWHLKPRGAAVSWRKAENGQVLLLYAVAGGTCLGCLFNV